MPISYAEIYKVKINKERSRHYVKQTDNSRTVSEHDFSDFNLESDEIKNGELDLHMLQKNLSTDLSEKNVSLDEVELQTANLNTRKEVRALSLPNFQNFISSIRSEQ